MVPCKQVILVNNGLKNIESIYRSAYGHVEDVSVWQIIKQW